MKRRWILGLLCGGAVCGGSLLVVSCDGANGDASGPSGYPYKVTTTVGMISDIVRNVAGEHAEVDPDTRSLTIMAAVERGEGASDSVVKGWLARALTAPRGPQWVCDNCQHIHAEWVPACENCNLLWLKKQTHLCPSLKSVAPT